MDSMRTETLNGYDIHVKAVMVHQGRGALLAGESRDDGYVPLVAIERDGEAYVDWHRPKQCRPRATRQQAEEDALAYASRLVDQRPFDGPIAA